MRANLALCFLHRPEVVYLDEPTIGLDVLAKERIRNFLISVNKELGTTIMLTTHDTQDIEEIAQRLILIDNGELLFDGEKDLFIEKYHGTSFLLDVVFKDTASVVENEDFLLVDRDGNRHTYQIDYDRMNHGSAITYVASNYPVEDIRVRQIGLESILKGIYKKNGDANGVRVGGNDT